MTPEIVTIAERPDLAPVIARLLWDEFWKAGGYTLAQTEAFVASATSPSGPPQCFVALVDGAPAGTASLTVADLEERPELTPWLANVFVDPAFRGQGLAWPLLAAVDRACQQAGITTLWLYTNTAEPLYARAGWAVAERIDRPGKRPVALMRKPITPPV